MQPKIEDLNEESETQFIVQSSPTPLCWTLELSKKAHTEAQVAFLLCPKKGQILHDSSCETWPATTFLSSQGTQQIKLDNCSKFTLIGQSTDHTTMSLGQVKCCIVTRSLILMRGWSLGMRLPGHCTEALIPICTRCDWTTLNPSNFSLSTTFWTNYFCTIGKL